MSNTIFLIVGESGSGKDTIVNELVRRYGMKRIDSYTTRPSRGPDDRHVFVDDYHEWLLRNPNDTVVGYTEFSGHHYWASASQVEENDLYIIDPDGVRFFRTAYTGPKSVKVVYLCVPAIVRFMRMMERGDGFISSMKRIIHDKTKFAGAMQMADRVIGDGSIGHMTGELWSYIHGCNN